ncbi:sensor histidine kinase [Streptomyces xanthii]|uniref:Oxygen sensor histidine kinase NreB n=1 Tax=Streptomyces xanthii TaxID=2768069 RepID=A0A7H1B8B9_9ACTN|nr:sensor histidine kinase [Streptomyces xanthii]
MTDADRRDPARTGRHARPADEPAPGPLTEHDPDGRWLEILMSVAFFVLLGSSMIRFVQRHGEEVKAPYVITLATVLAVLYIVGPRRGTVPNLPPGAPIPWPRPRRLAWLVVVIVVWAVLVDVAPSFAWVAVPLFYAILRTLPTVAAYVLVGLLTVVVIFAQLHLAGRFDQDLVIGPAAVAAFATAIFTQMQRQAARQRALIDDLIRTRRELAASERREGTLAERQRLSMEIHDTLAQGLSSQQMLLQAAERVWDTDSAKARVHVHTATSIAEHNLTEARRFVHDLAPADLADGLEAGLHAVAERASGERLSVRVHIDDGGRTPRLPDRVQSALLRIAQGALANVREHSGATEAAVTLTLLDDQVVLDVVDNGTGFDPATLPDASTGVRGHGVPAIRARVRQLGGTLTLDSAPGEGTVLTAAIPLSPRA